MQLTVNNPNFSIVMPGRCNAKCAFCFWEHTEAPADWLDKLTHVIKKLPPQFSQVSITGGEPTLSEQFQPVLRLIHGSFSKIVLTTNGMGFRGGFDGNIALTKHVVHHVNISRHAPAENDNAVLFGVKIGMVPTSEEISDLIDRLHGGPDVTMNAVIKPDEGDISKINSFIAYAKHLKFDAIALRKEHGSLAPTPVELEMEEINFVEGRGGCPACRSSHMKVDGFPVTWKASVSEPTQAMNGIYELVFQQDGRLTADWAGLIEVKLEEIEHNEVVMAKADPLDKAIAAAQAMLEALKELKAGNKKYINIYDPFLPNPTNIRETWEENQDLNLPLDNSCGSPRGGC